MLGKSKSKSKSKITFKTTELQSIHKDLKHYLNTVAGHAQMLMIIHDKDTHVKKHGFEMIKHIDQCIKYIDEHIPN